MRGFTSSKLRLATKAPANPAGSLRGEGSGGIGWGAEGRAALVNGWQGGPPGGGARIRPEEEKGSGSAEPSGVPVRGRGLPPPGA